MDQLAALRSLRRVVELGSFTAAADALGISHTIVSRQIKQLEAYLGAQLLNRTTRRFALTAAGQEYYEASRHILDALDDADRAVGQHQARPSGVLRISTPTAFGSQELAHWLPRFSSQYPDLKIDLVCNDRMVDLIEEGFDIGLRLARGLADSTLIARRLATSRVILVASPAYLKRHGVPRTPSDLLRHNCLVYTQGARPNDWAFTTPDGGAETVTVQGSLQSNATIALRNFALADMGIAIAATFIVHEDVKRGDLLQVLPDHTIRPRELYALYPRNRHLSPKVRVFIDFAAALYAQRGWD